MAKHLALLALLLFPAIAQAETPDPRNVLTEEEDLLMCAQALPRHLECKSESCAAMVKIRAKGASQSESKALERKCLQEIAVDGTGDLATRKGRCAIWAKHRPKMSVSRAAAKELDACWTKPTCQARLDCWAPKMQKLMAKLMEAAAAKPK